MKKTTFLFVFLLCTLHLFSARYLVQSGENGSSAWRTPIAGETLVDLTTEGKTLSDWLQNATFLANDEIWVIKGNYLVNSTWIPKVNVNIYGGFAGTESSINDREKGVNLWDYSNETILDGSVFPSTATSGVIDTYSKNIIIDGLTFTSVPLNSTYVIRQRPNSVIQNCKFIKNSTISISYYETTAVTTPGILNSCYFYQNSAAANAQKHSQGTCITATGGAPGSPAYKVNNCLFEENDNTSNIAQASGAVRVQGATIIENCIFKNNKITTTTYGSPSVVLMNGDCYLTNCLVYGSTGKQALYIHNGGKITNCTFANNPGQGAYIYPNADSSTLVFTNTVFWATINNDAYIFFSGGTATKATFTNCATRGISNAQTNTTSHIALDDVNPGFTDPAINDYTLIEGSVLIDAGSAVDAPTQDITGVVRPKGTGYEIGAYEFDPTLTSVSITEDSDRNISSVKGTILLEGLSNSEMVNIYSTNGLLLRTEKLNLGVNYINLPSNNLFIVQINNFKKKVLVK